MAPASFSAWRERLHLNITGAARALGVSRNLVMKFESGASEIPRHIELACIAILYGLKRFNPSSPTNSPPPMPPATQEP
jgi:transcriptional regulator with XRE-family HTH domain